VTKLLRTLFRASLHLFPNAFRDGYANEMKETFADRIASLSPLAACIATVAEIIDVILSAIRIRIATPIYSRSAMIGVLGTVVLAAMVTIDTVRRNPVASELAPLDSIDFEAQDPAGEFTLTVRHGRPVAATIDRIALPANRLVHLGDSVHFLGPSGRVVLAVAYYRDRARIEWHARPSMCRGRAVDCTLYQ
jgi:hypothetical protein